MSRPETAPLLSSDLRSSFTDSDSDFHPESRPILLQAQSVPASSRPFPSHSASTSPSYSGMGASRLNRSASAPSPHHHGGPAVQAPSRQVRINMLNGIRSSQYESLIFCLSVTFNLPQIIAVAIVLATHWNPNACDQPLHYWALIYAGRLSLLILTASFPLLCRTNMNHPVLRRWSETLNMIGFVWLSLGCYWLFSSHSCSTLATSVYQLCYALLLLNFLLFCAPCLCFCAMLPLVFFCLPALLRLSASLGPQRGATPIQIDAVPTERYNADSSSLDSEHTECAVCLVPYQEGEELRVLPCNSEERLRHRFHKECVDQWMRINGTCPVCRAPIVGEVAGASSGGVGAGASGAGARGEPLNAAEVQV